MRMRSCNGALECAELMRVLIFLNHTFLAIEVTGLC